MRKLFAGAALLGLLGVVLYAQEPAIFERGITIIRGNLYLGSGDIVLEGATGDAYETTFTVTDPTADRTITWPDSTGTVVLSSESEPFVSDDTRFGLGSDIDFVFYHKSTSTLANTVVTNVLIGTPVTPALAANTTIMSNVTADGDMLWATQTGGNSSAVFWSDASAQTTSIMVTGVATARFDSTDVLFPDDYILSLGTGASVAYKDDATNANTAVTSVILGTPVVPALAADTLIVANQIADGDLLLATQTGANTQAALFVDGSAGTVGLYGAGVQMAQVDSTSLNVGLSGTTTGRIEISGATSGTISILPSAAAGTYTLTLPSTSTAAALFYSTLTTNAIDVANSVWGVSAGITFEGSDADTEELFLTLVDPTADITISFNNDLADTYYPLTIPDGDVTGGVFIMPPFGIAATDNDLSMADNTLYVYRVYIPQWITVANIYARGTQGGDIAATDDLLGVAIYEDADAGAVLGDVQTSADFTATANVTFDITDVTLGPGFYRVAVCSGDGSGIAYVAGDPIDDEAIDVYNLGAVTIGTGANSCTAGVPPTTTGALTTADILMPVLKFGP